MKKRILLNATIACSAIAASFCSISCSTKHHYITWSGNKSTFEPNYDLYTEESISQLNSLKVYSLQENAKTMFSQDWINYVNHNISTEEMRWSMGDCEYGFEILKIEQSSVMGNVRLSFNAYIKNLIWDKNLIEIEVTNLNFWARVYLPPESQITYLYFLPYNVFWNDDGDLIVDKKFWADTAFNIYINEFDDRGNLRNWYNFSCKTLDLEEQLTFNTRYTQFLLFHPWFYKNTILQ